MKNLKLKAALETASFVIGCLLATTAVNLLVMYHDRLPFTMHDVLFVASVMGMVWMIHLMYRLRLEALERKEKLALYNKSEN